jgi:hypothetical protein
VGVSHSSAIFGGAPSRLAPDVDRRRAVGAVRLASLPIEARENAPASVRTDVGPRLRTHLPGRGCAEASLSTGYYALRRSTRLFQ